MQFGTEEQLDFLKKAYEAMAERCEAIDNALDDSPTNEASAEELSKLLGLVCDAIRLLNDIETERASYLEDQKLTDLRRAYLISAIDERVGIIRGWVAVSRGTLMVNGVEPDVG